MPAFSQILVAILALVGLVTIAGGKDFLKSLEGSLKVYIEAIVQKSSPTGGQSGSKKQPSVQPPVVAPALKQRKRRPPAMCPSRRVFGGGLDASILAAAGFYRPLDAARNASPAAVPASDALTICRIILL
jgi:hypothetical protein